MSSSVKRIDWLDIAKAIAIIGTVGCHTFSAHPILLALSFSTFLTFWIVSGYTITPCNGLHGVVNKALSDFKRMIIPSFFVCLLSGVLTTITGEYRDWNSLVINIKQCVQFFVGTNPGMLWFFWTLLWAKLLYRLMLKMGWFRYIVIVPLLVLALIYSPDHRLPLVIDVTPVAIAYLEVGHLIRLYDEKMNSGNKIMRGIAGVVISVVSLLGAYYLTIVRRLFIDPGSRDYTILAMVQCLTVMVIIVIVARLVADTVFCDRISEFGKHTLGFLLLHFLDGFWLLPLTDKLFEFTGFYNDYVFFAIRVVLLIVATKICVFFQERFYYYIDHAKR